MATVLTLPTFKLVSAKRPAEKPAIELKRDKLINRIAEQIEIAVARAKGTTYQKSVTRKVRDQESGLMKQVQLLQYPKPWWWTGDDGKLYLSVRYGVRAIELAKGKSAIEVGTQAALVQTLEKLKAAVANSELDAALENFKVEKKASK